jgi:hypothetical protein
MICPVKLANEMSGLSGTFVSSMTRCGNEADELDPRGGAMKLQKVMLHLVCLRGRSTTCKNFIL